MKFKILFYVLIFLFISVSAKADKIDDILKSIDKANGYSNSEKFTSVHWKGIINNMGMDLPLEFHFKKENNFRLEVDFMGQKMIQIYDGKEGWMYNPMAGPDPIELPPDQLDNMKKQNENIMSPFANLRKDSAKVELAGNETIDSKDCFKILVTDKGGKTSTLFVDAKSYMPVKAVSKTAGPDGTETDQEVLFKEFKNIDGVMIPQLMETNAGGMTGSIKIELFEVNKPIDDKLFKKQ